MLMDGSEAAESAVELKGAKSPALMTKVHVVDVDDVESGSLSADCLRATEEETTPSSPLVERIGVSSETVTLRSGRGLYGCDDTPGPRENGRRWCGSSFGRLYSGRLRDPRLDIAGCRTVNGTPMGLAWVEPGPITRYVVVRQPGYSEVYETAGGLPLRIASTTGVEVEGSRASFEISEHDASGRLLRRYRLDAAVAG
jgi:hypothetical protein